MYAKDIVNRLLSTKALTKALPWIVIKGTFLHETTEALAELEALDHCVFS